MTILIATFALVFFRALQQLNVTGRHYVAAAATSYAIAAAEVSVILMSIRYGWPAIPWMGTGGALGVTLAMAMHIRTIGKPREERT